MMLDTVKGKGSGASAPADPALADATSPAASSGVRRLHPADGLFLRAEHLDQIQAYAAELARLGTAAGGAGVVYGFTLDLDRDKEVLGATAGAAIDPTGRPLRSLGRLEVDLSGLERGAIGRIWIVEVIAAEPIPSGSEPVYSAVCATSCGPQSSIQPWLDDAVALRVRAETLDWVAVNEYRTRSAIASAFFDRERRLGDPWLTPASAGAVVPDLATRPWATATPAAPPAPAGVPVGLLAWIGGTWVLDVWAARRDRGPTPPEAGWQNHLALRPAPVFTAQVLQFQDQLALVPRPVSVKDPLTEWFVELPPAGYLPVPAGLTNQDPGTDDSNDDDIALEKWVHAVFGQGVQLQFNQCSADVAVTAVNLAQHFDRIPLTGYDNWRNKDPQRLADDPRPRVQILVPDITADLPAVRTDDYGWVAFVRAPRVRSFPVPVPRPVPGQPPEPAPAQPAPAQPAAEPPRATASTVSPVAEPEPILAYLVDAPSSRSRYAQRAETAATADPLLEMRFSGWEPASDDSALEALRHALEESGPYSTVDVVASTADLTREPLAAARARTLVTQLGLDATETPAGVYTIRLEGPEAVFLMVRRAR